MFKRVMTMILALAMAAALFTACAPAGANGTNGTANASGKVYAPVDFEGSTGESMLPPVVNAKGELTVASQTAGAPVKITTYDASGKKSGEVTTDVTGPAANFTLDEKDQAYVLTVSEQDKGTVHVLDASGKTVKTIPLGDVLQSLPDRGGKAFSRDGGKAPAAEAQAAVQNTAAQQTAAQPSAGQQTEPQANGQQAEGEQPAEGQGDEPKVLMSDIGINGFAASSDGSVYISAMGLGVMQIDSAGKLVRTYNANMMTLIAMNDKEQLLVFSEGQGMPSLATYDTASGSEVSKVDSALNGPSKIFYDRTGKKLYYINGNGVYSLKDDGTSGDALAKLNDISFDTSSRSLQGFAMDGAGSIYISSADSSSGGMMMKTGGGSANLSTTLSKADRIDRLALVDASSVQQKKVLTVAGISGNSMLNAAIAEFQKTHPDYKVDVKTYENEIIGMKQQAASQSGPISMDIGSIIQQFNTDIISGNSADVFLLDNLPYYKYIDKGILADLGQMMADDKMDTSGYYNNIFDACKVNGKLYTIPTAFSYSILAGKSANMPSGETPTVDEFFQKVNSLPSGVAAFAKGDPIRAFSEFLQDSYGYFVDQTGHTARFNSPEFIKVLSDFKAMVDSRMSAVSEDEESSLEQIGEDKLAYTSMNLRRIEELSMLKAVAGDSVAFSKMPAMEQGAYNFNARGLFGINASSQNKQAAWDFIKILLSQEMQSSMQLDGFPVNKAASAERIEKMKGTGVMGKENTRLVIRTQKGEYEAKPLSDAEYAALAETFGKLNKLSAPDENVVKILDEELPAFFSGQKSANDVAALIQNRVMTILSE